MPVVAITKQLRVRTYVNLSCIPTSDTAGRVGFADVDGECPLGPLTDGMRLEYRIGENRRCRKQRQSPANAVS